MAGAGLIAIKRRIKSVTNTRKITKAMGLVATSKLRQNRSKLEVNNKFFSSYENIMNEVINAIEDHESIYTKGNGSNKRLYVVFTSDQGLCGGFNGNSVKETIEQLKTDRENSLVMVIGQKGRTYFNRSKIETVAEYVDIPDVPTNKEAKTIAQHIMRLYRDGEIGQVHAVYTKFQSTVKQEVTVKKLLPFEVSGNKANAGIILEPDGNELLEDTSDTFIQQTILNFMFHSKCSEMAMRMNAMDGATKNANELLEKLNLLFNRIRQSVITQEISEIVGGAEAQK